MMMPIERLFIQSCFARRQLPSPAARAADSYFMQAPNARADVLLTRGPRASAVSYFYIILMP